MSMQAYHYVILGYDFSKNRDKIIDDDWKWTPEGEEWTCRASKGNIQMFTDINDGYKYGTENTVRRINGEKETGGRGYEEIEFTISRRASRISINHCNRLELVVL